MTRDERVSAYIERQAGFAQPILNEIRDRVARHCPDANETIRWGMPSWTLDGRILCNMAAFKAHATFGFWRGADVMGDAGKAGAMGQFGRIASIGDLPDEDSFAALLNRARALAESGQTAAPPKPPRPEAAMPPAFQAALDSNAAAYATFASFPPGQRREYLDWITDAKRDDTRTKRIAQAVEWLAEGKRRNWKYERC